MTASPDLFGPDLPPGFEYRDNFISEAEEAALLTDIGNVTFADFEMRGVVARRRVAFFGESYDRNTRSAVPEFLRPLRSRVAEWAGVPDDAFSMALINEYPPGAPIGWHRDAPQYDIVAGLSLLSACRMTFRPYSPPSLKVRRTTSHEILLEPRSAYIMRDEARQAYEHHIPAVAQLRYSITFRTAR